DGDAVAARHADVHHDDVELVVPDGGERGVAVGRRRHPVAGRGQDVGERLAHPGLVVGDEHGAHAGVSAFGTSAPGSLTANVVPSPGADRTAIVPPWASTIRRVTARPRPIPFALRV